MPVQPLIAQLEHEVEGGLDVEPSRRLPRRRACSVSLSVNTLFSKLEHGVELAEDELRDSGGRRYAPIMLLESDPYIMDPP